MVLLNLGYRSLLNKFVLASVAIGALAIVRAALTAETDDERDEVVGGDDDDGGGVDDAVDEAKMSHPTSAVAPAVMPSSEAAEPAMKEEEANEPKHAATSAGSTPVVSAGIGLSMWKIYYDYCCKMNDLQDELVNQASHSVGMAPTAVTNVRPATVASAAKAVRLPSPQRKKVSCKRNHQHRRRSVSGPLTAVGIASYDRSRRKRRPRRDRQHATFSATESECSDHSTMSDAFIMSEYARRRCVRQHFTAWRALMRKSPQSHDYSDDISAVFPTRLDNVEEETNTQHHAISSNQNSPSKEEGSYFLTRTVRAPSLPLVLTKLQQHTERLGSVNSPTSAASTDVDSCFCLPETTDQCTKKEGPDEELSLICARQIYKAWRMKRLSKVAWNRVSLRRGFKVLKDNVAMHTGVAKVQHAWRAYSARQRAHAHWRNQLLHSIVRNWKVAAAQERVASQLICHRVEMWWTHTMKQRLNQVKKDKRKRWLRKKRELEQRRHQQQTATQIRKQTDELVLSMELRRWVSQVMKHIHLTSRVIPPTAELFSSFPRLRKVLLLRQRLSESALTQRQTSHQSRYSHVPVESWFLNQLKANPAPRQVLCQWLDRVVTKRRYKDALHHTCSRIFLASNTIQVAVKCRFAIMLLTAKYKYLQGVLQCQELTRLGTDTRAAVIVQAAWRYSRASIAWKRYIVICKLRLTVLGSLARKCVGQIERRNQEAVVDEIRLSWLRSSIPTVQRVKLDVEAIRRFLDVAPPQVTDQHVHSSPWSPRCA